MSVVSIAGSGCGWNLWVWLVGVIASRDKDFLISYYLSLNTPLVSVFFCSSIPCSFFKCFSFLFRWVECMGVVNRSWMWVESMGVTRGCGCMEVYGDPHITYPYSSCIYISFFAAAAASLLFVHSLNVFRSCSCTFYV